MPSYLVTGGAGFIGSHICEHLIAGGADVRALDDLSTGKRSNIEHLLPQLDFVEGDIRNPDTVASAMRDIDVVLHQAALPSVPVSVEQPVETNDVNIGGTVLLLEAARAAKVKRFVFAGSSAVYGAQEGVVCDEHTLPAPQSPYAVQKLAGEQYLLAYHHCHGLPVCVLRYLNVFGERQDPNSQYAAVIPKFITAVLEGEAPTIFGDGEQTRDFTHVENNVRANLIAAEHPRAVGEVFNVATGVSVSLLELLRIVSELMGRVVQPKHARVRAGDVKHSRASGAKAKDLLGYTPHIDLREGLRRTIEFFSKAAV